MKITTNVTIINVFIIIDSSSSSKNMLANQSSSSSPSPSTASKPSFFHHRNHNRRHHNAQETLVTSRQRKHQRGKKNTAHQCQTKPITTKIRFNKIKHAPHQNFTQHASQSRFNAIAIAIAAKSNSGIRLQFVNNMHNSNKKRNLKAMQNQHRKSKSNSPITTNNRDRKMTINNQTSTASPSILILFTIIEFVIKQITRDCNSQYCL